MDKNGKEIKYFSMFTGVGGFELGLEANNPKPLSEVEQDREGRDRTSEESRTLFCSRHKPSFRCVGVSEIDRHASKLLANKFPAVKNFGDATKIIPSELPDFDLLCGGFPCQAFSIAGKRRGFEDTRGTLFFEVARILEVKRPRNILLENVKGLLNHEEGQTFATILHTLAKLGYRVEWMVLNSKFHGVPQNRERVLIIGSLRGECRPEILPFRENDKETIRKGHSVGLEQTAQCLKARDYANWGGNFTTDGNARTITAGGHSGGLHSDMQWLSKSDQRIRRLTPLECERLQGFPDGWTEGFSDSQRYKMMGNAVTVNVIKALGERIIQENG